MNEDRARENGPLDDERLQEAMEACRPGSDDLRDPQFSALAERLAADPALRARFERLQQIDSQIKAAFQNVPLPEGLSTRISLRLREVAPSPPPPLAPSGSSGSPLDGTDGSYGTYPRRSARSRRFSRRALVLSAGSMAAAAALLVAVVLQLNKRQPDTPAKILNEAMRFFDTDVADEGSPVATSPAEYPIRDLRGLRGIQWRWVKNFLGGEAVAYDLPSQGGRRATLYVARRTTPTVPRLPTFPPDEPTFSTAGKAVGAWLVDETTLYVLVVEGDASVYRGYLDRSSGPWT